MQTLFSFSSNLNSSFVLYVYMFWIYKPKPFILSLHNCCTVAPILFGKRKQKHKTCLHTCLPACVKLQVTAFSICTFFCPLVALYVPARNGSAEPVLVGVEKHVCTGKINRFPHIFQWIWIRNWILKRSRGKHKHTRRQQHRTLFFKYLISKWSGKDF